MTLWYGILGYLDVTADVSVVSYVKTIHIFERIIVLLSQRHHRFCCVCFTFSFVTFFDIRGRSFDSSFMLALGLARTIVTAASHRPRFCLVANKSPLVWASVADAALNYCQSRRTTVSSSAVGAPLEDEDCDTNRQHQQQEQLRLSKVLSTSKNFTFSRREAERHIKSGDVTVAGWVVTKPHALVSVSEMTSIKVKGKIVQPGNQTDDGTNNETRVWLVHKLAGELVAEFDPLQRPLLMERLQRGGVGRRDAHRNKTNWHLKPVGRLDVSTEGLMVVTNDGAYARAMELPTNQLHRTYRVRVHGLLHAYKLTRIERGMTIEGVRYRGMKVNVEKPRRSKASSTNQWITLTCTEGKNRQVRNVLQHLGCTFCRDESVLCFVPQ